MFQQLVSDRESREACVSAVAGVGGTCARTAFELNMRKRDSRRSSNMRCMAEFLSTGAHASCVRVAGILPASGFGC